MPEQKGRKRRHLRERRRSGDAPMATATLEPDPKAPRVGAKSKGSAATTPLPSMTARVTGLMIAVITLVLAVAMVYGSITGGASGVDGIARIVAGVLLIGLAIVVGVLATVPGQVRDWFARRR